MRVSVYRHPLLQRRSAPQNATDMSPERAAAINAARPAVQEALENITKYRAGLAVVEAAATPAIEALIKAAGNKAGPFLLGERTVIFRRHHRRPGDTSPIVWSVEDYIAKTAI